MLRRGNMIGSGVIQIQSHGSNLFQAKFHGFPHSPSALAYDEELSLKCICTKNGAVRVYGAPGVEFVGYHQQESSVVQVHFVPGQGGSLYG